MHANTLECNEISQELLSEAAAWLRVDGWSQRGDINVGLNRVIRIERVIEWSAE